MKAFRILCLAMIALPCASNAAEPSPAPATALAPASPAPENVQTVTLDPNERRPVCRRHVPTGSRIAEQRCEAAKREATASDRANHEIMRRDIDALRDQQMMREQARQAAALRRRGGL
jgi:hypothetical protein